MTTKIGPFLTVLPPNGARRQANRASDAAELVWCVIQLTVAISRESAKLVVEVRATKNPLLCLRCCQPGGTHHVGGHPYYHCLCGDRVVYRRHV